jgi:hypothetical protein
MIFRARATRGLRKMRGSRQTVLLARRAPTIKRWSLDARSEEQSAYSLWGCWGIRRPSLDARNGRSISPHP